MAGTLASFDDANAHLDESKIAFVDDVDAEDEARAAYNEVASYVGHLWPDHIDLWDYAPEAGTSEEATPQLIRYIASLLMASYRYAKLYSEENLNENDYSARLEARAIAKLEQLRDGSLVLWDVDYGTITAGGGKYERGDFWPDNTYTPESIEFEREIADPDLQPARSFSMGMEL